MFDKFDKACKNFYDVTGIPCKIISENSDVIGRCCPTLISDVAPNFVQNHRFGGKNIYFSPNGFHYIISPIYYRRSQYSIIAGPFLVDGIVEQAVLLDVEEDSRFLDLPEIASVKVEALFGMLYYISKHLSDYDFNAEFYDFDFTFNLSIKTSYPIQKERELLSAVSQMNKEAAQELLNELLGYIFFSSDNDVEVIKTRILEITILISRAAVSAGMDIEEILSYNLIYIKSIQESKNLDELTYLISTIMQRFTNYIFNFASARHGDIMRKAVGYVNQHYSEKITLEDVASYVNLSSNYFSQIFALEMNKSFNLFLNTIRVEKSKALLKNTNMSLTEIALKTGFEDQSYFTKVFKRLTGTTPKYYRESVF